MRIDLRDASWFGRERATGYARMMAMAFAPLFIWIYLKAMGPLGSDFLAFWSAAKLALAGSAAQAYDARAMSGLQHALGRDHWFPFLNPPPFLALVLPLGWMSYPVAWLAWVATTYAAWLIVARRLVPGGIWPIAVYPGALIAAWHAQNGLVTGALFVGGVLALRASRPMLAGVLLGALVIKPHLGVLIPVALLAAREWRAIAAAAATAIGLLLAGAAAFGPETTRAFLAATKLSASLLALDRDFLLRMPTVFADVAVLAGRPAAIIAQALSTAAMAIIVWRAWRRPIDILAKGAVLAVATVLATPYLFHYDLPLLILPACWMALEGMRTGFRPWERLALAVFYWTPFLSRAFSLPMGFNTAPLVLAAFLWFALRRLAIEVPAQPNRRAA